MNENESSKELLKKVKENKFNLTAPLLKEVLKRKDIKQLMEKELEALLGRTEATIKKNSSYLFNLIMLLNEFKSRVVYKKIPEISNYSQSFLEKVFGDFIVYLEPIFLEGVLKNEKIYYEKSIQNQNQLTLYMIKALTIQFSKYGKKELEEYLIVIAIKKIEPKDELYTVLKLITLVENGYSKAETNLNAKRRNIKNPEIFDFFEIYHKEKMKGQKKKTTKKNPPEIKVR